MAVACGGGGVSTDRREVNANEGGSSGSAGAAYLEAALGQKETLAG